MRKPEDDLPEQMKLLDFVIVDYINFFFFPEHCLEMIATYTSVN